MMRQALLPGMPVTRHAVFSEDRSCRFALYQSLDGTAWDRKGHRLCNFILCNPSDADEEDDDPTLTRVTRFGSDWGYSLLAVTNVHPLVETDSRKLQVLLRTRGGRFLEENRQWVCRVAKKAEIVVCGWGAAGSSTSSAWVESYLREQHIPLRCFKRTQSGAPIHPLYQPASAQPIPY